MTTVVPLLYYTLAEALFFLVFLFIRDFQGHILIDKFMAYVSKTWFL